MSQDPDDSLGYDPLADARKAASVIVLRDGPPAGLEVLMLRRAEREGDIRSGVMVFPGGVLDERDREAHAHCIGWSDEQASARLGLAAGGLDYLVAAVRESFEEVGLLFGHGLDPHRLQQAHEHWRGPMQRGERPISQLCRELGLQLDLRDWAYFSHWLTPPGVNKRFDTRFFVTRAPEGQQAQADLGEAVELMWLTPTQALDPQSGLKLLPVTRRTLQTLERFSDAHAVIEHARSQTQVALTMPRRAESAKGLRVVLPDEHAWAEIGRIDPAGRGGACADIVPGRAVRLSARVIRITAPNAGVMTGPGTNSYLVGCPQAQRWAVIDPGPDDALHLQALRDAAPGPIDLILVTHTHIDHSPGAAALARLTGAAVWGRRPAHAAGQDPDFAPTRELSGGERIEIGSSTTLEVLHTPGHASNHLCFLLAQERLLFTGDHVMQGSTVVINPPDGDMGAYLQALERLLQIDLQWLAPGHGFLVARPHEVVRSLIRHRLAREGKVLRALQAASAGVAVGQGREGGEGGDRGTPIEALLPRVYDDVPERLHAVARRSLLAHLIKLQQDGRARLQGEHWSPA